MVTITVYGSHCPKQESPEASEETFSLQMGNYLEQAMGIHPDDIHIIFIPNARLRLPNKATHFVKARLEGDELTDRFFSLDRKLDFAKILVTYTSGNFYCRHCGAATISCVAHFPDGTLVKAQGDELAGDICTFS